MMLKFVKKWSDFFVIPFFFSTFAKKLDFMISKQKTLKVIKEKVDARANGKIKLKKHVTTDLVCGLFKHTETKNIKEVFKHGNSVFCVDDNYEVRNINELDGKALRTILWQLITDKEKKEIALEHLYDTMDYLKEV